MKRIKYFDSSGFIHHKEIDLFLDVETSENGPLFTAVYGVLIRWQRGYFHLDTEDGLMAFKQLLGSTYGESNRYLRPNNRTPFKSSHMSYDNVLGLYSANKLMGGKLGRLPSLWWWSENKPYARLESLLFMSIKYWWLLKPFGYLIAFIMMYFSLKKPYFNTSGKQKWFLRVELFFPLLKPYFYKKIEEMYKNSIYDVFYIYYLKNEDHPTVRLSKDFVKSERDIFVP